LVAMDGLHTFGYTFILRLRGGACNGRILVLLGIALAHAA
jgi:hypothetical protein